MTSLPTREVPRLTLEALNEACGLLNETLERGEHQFGHLCRLVELLEADLVIVDQAAERGSAQSGLNAFSFFAGVGRGLPTVVSSAWGVLRFSRSDSGTWSARRGFDDGFGCF